jgi:hypothetical protein
MLYNDRVGSEKPAFGADQEPLSEGLLSSFGSRPMLATQAQILS